MAQRINNYNSNKIMDLQLGNTTPFTKEEINRKTRDRAMDFATRCINGSAEDMVKAAEKIRKFLTTK